MAGFGVANLPNVINAGYHLGRNAISLEVYNRLKQLGSRVLTNVVNAAGDEISNNFGIRRSQRPAYSHAWQQSKAPRGTPLLGIGDEDWTNKHQPQEDTEVFFSGKDIRREQKYYKKMARFYARGRSRFSSRGRSFSRSRFKRKFSSFRKGGRRAGSSGRGYMRTVPRMAFPQGLQMKWYDVQLNDTTQFVLDNAFRSLGTVPPCANANATAIAKMSSLFGGITPGTAVGQRIGRRVVCNSIFMDIKFTMDPDNHFAQASDAVFANLFSGASVPAGYQETCTEDYIHIIIFKDTQCNGTAPFLNALYDAASMFAGSVPNEAVATWKRNMDNILQYKILAHKKIKWHPGDNSGQLNMFWDPNSSVYRAWNTTGPSMQQATVSVKCAELINYGPGSAGTVSDLVDTNVGVFVVAERHNAGGHLGSVINCSVSYRVRFQDLT